MRRVGKDPVSGDARVLHRAFGLARIRVDVEMREVAARDVEAQPVLAGQGLGTKNSLMASILSEGAGGEGGEG